MKFSQGNNKASKLTGEQVLSIRQLYTTGDYSYAALARQFQVSLNTVANIINMVTWQRVAGAGLGAGLNKPSTVSETEIAASFERLKACMASPPVQIEADEGKGLDKLQRLAVDRFGARINTSQGLDELMDGKPKES